jgi:hypothetical protein
MQRAGRLGDGWLVSFAEHLTELEDKVSQSRRLFRNPISNEIDHVRK